MPKREEIIFIHPSLFHQTYKKIDERHPLSQPSLLYHPSYHQTGVRASLDNWAQNSTGIMYVGLYNHLNEVRLGMSL